MGAEFVQVLTSTGSEEEAANVSDALLDARLAACVQVVGPIRSRYRWKGEVQSDQEWLCIAKTTLERFEAAADAIRSAHSYDVPEITAVPIAAGSPDYLSWIAEEVSTP